MGPVFRAHDPEHDRLVAIKTFKLDLIPEDAGRLAEALGRLVQDGPDHPALAAFVQAGLERGVTPYLATSFAAGETLDVYLRGRGPMTPEDALAVLAPVADALDVAWADAVGHLALHPRDIFVTGDLEHVTLTGLGVTGALAAVGVSRPPRRPYAAPETADQGGGDARADIYSLAAVAHEMLTGRRPSSSGVGDVGFADEVDAAQAKALREVLAAAMATDPAARPATARAFVDAIRTAIDRGQPALPLILGPDAGEAEAVDPFEDAVDDALAPVHALDADPSDTADVDAADAADRLRPEPRPRRSFADDLPAPPPPPASHGGWRLAIMAVLGLAIGLAGLAMFMRDQGAETTEVVVDRALDDGAPAAAAEGADPTDTEVDLREDLPAVAAADSTPAASPVQPPPAAAPPAQPVAPPARRVTAPTGQVLVRSEPSGALVLVDGQLRGETPATVRDLSLGTHAIQIARPGYAPETRSVTLTPEAPSRNLTVALQAGLDPAADLAGSMYADSRPRGARVLIDGRLVGTTPLRLPGLSAGRRAVRIELDGYRTVTTTVSVTGGREARVTVTLEPASGRAGGR